MWRGLVLNRAVQQFLQDAHWGDLDYLLIDLPPGTGDIQMGLARLLPRTEMLVVTTPPLAAQKVAARAADMARRGYLRVAGVIENMSDFTCEHGTTYALFGSGGGERLAQSLGVPLVGSIPLHPDLAAAGDAGIPVALDGDSELGADLRRAGPGRQRRGRPPGRGRRLQRPHARARRGSGGPAAKRRGRNPACPQSVPRSSRLLRRASEPTLAIQCLEVVRARRLAGHAGPSLLDQRPQMGPQREAGHRELAFGDIAVDLAAATRPPSPHHAERAPRPPAHGGPGGGRSARRQLGHVVHDAPVAGPQDADRGALVPDRARLARYWCRSPSGGRITTVEPCITWSPVSRRRAPPPASTGDRRRGPACAGRAASGRPTARDNRNVQPSPAVRSGREVLGRAEPITGAPVAAARAAAPGA